MILETFSSPVILFFILGLLAGFMKSDLSIPEALAKSMSIYLMAAIGLKGGVEVAKAGISIELVYASVAGVLLGLAIPYLAFALLKYIGKLDRTNAGAVAAHYGSVSVVTFVTATEILGAQALEAAGYMVAVLALMETPAIISGLMLARGGQKPDQGGGKSKLLHEVFLNASVVLLVGAFCIGYVAGEDKFAAVAPFFQAGFSGVLCLFLLDMGLIAARRLSSAKLLTPALVALGIILPLINGVIGTLVGTLIGLDTASAAMLGVLAGSASYIAVPAAMRLALPQADPGLYLSMSIGITFPFNIIFGISIFTALAKALA